MGTLLGDDADCETATEERVLGIFRRTVVSFWLFLTVSVLLAWFLTYERLAESVVGAAGLPAGGAGSAWAVVLVPLVLFVPVSLLVFVVLAHGYEVRALSASEIDRLETRLRGSLARSVGGAGIAAVVLLLVIASDVSLLPYATASPGPFETRLAELWGVAIYGTAGATGLLTGALYTLDLRGVALFGLCFTVGATLCYPQTVLVLV